MPPGSKLHQCAQTVDFMDGKLALPGAVRRFSREVKLRAGFVVLLSGLQRVHERSQCEFRAVWSALHICNRRGRTTNPSAQV